MNRTSDPVGDWLAISRPRLLFSEIFSSSSGALIMPSLDCSRRLLFHSTSRPWRARRRRDGSQGPSCNTLVPDAFVLVDLVQPLVLRPQLRSLSRSSLVIPAAPLVPISCCDSQRRTDSREKPSDSTTWTWTARSVESGRCSAAKVPDEHEFATKSELAKAIVTRCLAGGAQRRCG